MINILRRFLPAPLRLVPRRGKEWIGSEMRRRGELAAERLRGALAELEATSSTLPGTPEEHGHLRDTIPPGQPYIIGNGYQEPPP